MAVTLKRKMLSVRSALRCHPEILGTREASAWHTNACMTAIAIPKYRPVSSFTLSLLVPHIFVYLLELGKGSIFFFRLVPTFRKFLSVPTGTVQWLLGFYCIWRLSVGTVAVYSLLLWHVRLWHCRVSIATCLLLPLTSTLSCVLRRHFADIHFTKKTQPEFRDDQYWRGVRPLCFFLI